MAKVFLVHILAAITGVPHAFWNNQDLISPASHGWAETVLVQVPDRAKASREPSMRLFLRIKLATFLWKNSPSFIPSHAAIAQQLAEECLVEMDADGDKVIEPYFTQFKRELSALVEIHSPDIAAKIKKQDFQKSTRAGDAFLAALSLIEQPDGRVQAIGLIENALRNGQRPNSTIFFILQRLQQQAPKEIPQLLLALLATEEERPGTLTLESLFGLRPFCMAAETPRELQAQFLRVTVSLLERSQPSPIATMQAHQFLASLLPSIERISPQLHPRAVRILAALKTSMTPEIHERVAAEERLRNSSDRLNQLLVEARAAKDEALKNGFLSEAARLALDSKQFRRALEIAQSVSDSGDYKRWRESFSRDLIEKALKEKDVEIAKEAASRIESVGPKALALQTIARHYSGGGDIASAREHLNEAARLAQSQDNSIEKLRLLLSIGAAFIKIDQLRVGEMFRAAVSIVNTLLRRVDEDPHKKSQAQSQLILMQSAWNLFPAFKGLAVFDHQTAAVLAAEIADSDLRTCALLGASIGVLESNKKSVSSPEGRKNSKAGH